MSFKKIALTQGQEATVSESDYDHLSQFKWRAFWNKNTQSFYAVRSAIRDGKRACVMMHREILGLAGGRHNPVDHINHDTLDNRRENIRVCTIAQNRANCRIPRSNTSGSKGVTWHTATKKWRARLFIDKRSVSLGLHNTKQQAEEAYRDGCRTHFGEFSHV